MKISEIFGPTFQGEGPSAGRTATFLRLAACNLTCTWCDTKYTWDWDNYSYADEVTRMTPPEVVEKLLALPSTDLLVISGGEPLLHDKDLPGVLEFAAHHYDEVHVETNGTIAPLHSSEFVDLWTVSPKLVNSGVSVKDRRKWDVLRLFALAPSVFKFVVQTPSDLAEVQLIQDKIGVANDRIWIMPEGVTPEGIMATGQLIADQVAALGWSMTLRMQQLLWPKVRAR